MPAARPRSSVSGVTMAPAASSVPSIPSLSPAMAQTLASPAMATAKPSRNSVLRPPRPAGSRPIVTVVSPPDRITAGPATGKPLVRTDRAMPAVIVPSSRLSPSSASPRTSGVSPSWRAASAAAPRASRGAAINRTSHANSPGFGASLPSAKMLRSAKMLWTAGGRAIAYRATISRASASVLGSGTVGRW